MKINYSLFFALFALLFAFVSCSGGPHDDKNLKATAEQAVKDLQDQLLRRVSEAYTKRKDFAKVIEETKEKLESNPNDILKEAGLEKYYNSETSEFAAGIVLIAAGIALAFMGRRIFKLFLTLSGLIVGASAGLYLIVFIENMWSPETPAPVYIFWSACIIGALSGAYLFNTAWRWGIYIMAAFGGYLVGMWALTLVPLNYAEKMPNNQVVLAVFAILGGVAAKFLDELVVITSSSLIGAFAIFVGVDLLHPVGFRAHIANFTSSQNVDAKTIIVEAMGADNIYYCMLGVLFFTVVGIYVQYRHQPRSYDKD